jgi:hypothetical protein
MIMSFRQHPLYESRVRPSFCSIIETLFNRYQQRDKDLNSIKINLMRL